jgi:hypothetical protein
MLLALVKDDLDDSALDRLKTVRLTIHQGR